MTNVSDLRGTPATFGVCRRFGDDSGDGRTLCHASDNRSRPGFLVRLAGAERTRSHQERKVATAG